MPSGKPSALKRLSDDALRKRLQELEDGLKEMSEKFAREAKSAFDSIEKDLNALAEMDIQSRLEPIFKDGEEQLDKMHDEFLAAVERERKVFERDDGEDDEEEPAE